MPTVISLRSLFGMVMVVVLGQATVLAQRGPIHYQHAGILLPGAIGSRQLERGGPLRGFLQPVEIRAPKGALVSLAVEGQLEKPQSSPRVVGMLIAPVYRLRVTNIPRNEGLEIYPTIEIIDRLYSPVGKKWNFPIPIELTREELELAIKGKYVTRVIYLENPQTALPIASDGKQQEYVNLRAGENPLEVADRLGRPVAILRIGGRIPENLQNPGEKFLYGSPPWTKPPKMPDARDRRPEPAAAAKARPADVPRLLGRPAAASSRKAVVR